MDLFVTISQLGIAGALVTSSGVSAIQRSTPTARLEVPSVVTGSVRALPTSMNLTSQVNTNDSLVSKSTHHFSKCDAACKLARYRTKPEEIDPITSFDVSPTPNSMPLVSPESEPVAPPETVVLSGNGLLTAVNGYRSKLGLNLLLSDDQLCKVAEQRVAQIQRSFSHDGFSDALASLTYRRVAENIWRGTANNESQIVAAWADSRSHHEALVGDWDYGCGAYQSGYAVFKFLQR